MANIINFRLIVLLTSKCSLHSIVTGLDINFLYVYLDQHIIITDKIEVINTNLFTNVKNIIKICYRVNNGKTKIKYGIKRKGIFIFSFLSH